MNSLARCVSAVPAAIDQRSRVRRSGLLAMTISAMLTSACATAQPAQHAQTASTEANGQKTAPSLGKAPSIDANLAFLHYADLKGPSAWYEHVLGLEKLADHGWLVMFRLASGAQLGLVNAGNPVARKRDTIPNRPMLTIETQELEAWWDRLKDRPDVTIVNGIGIDANGLITEFRIRDPEGYMIEFFTWRDGAKPPR